MDPIAFEESKQNTSFEPKPNDEPKETTPNPFMATPEEKKESPQNDAQSPVIPSSPSQGKGFPLLKSYAYLPEYAVLLIVLLAAVSAITTLFGLGIENLAGQKTVSDDPFGYTSGLNSFLLVSSLSSLMVTVPLGAWLFVRTKRSEADDPLITQHRWRKGFLGTFLVLQTLGIIGSLFSLAFNLIARVIGPNEIMSLLSDSDASLPIWAPIVTALLSVSLMSFVVFVMSRDYRKQRG